MAAGKETQLLAAYVAVGTDELKAARTLERMDERLVKAGGDPDFDKEVFEGDKLSDAALLRSSLDVLPFLSEFRLVVIKNVDKAPKAVTEAIVSYLDNPSATTVLMMTAQKLAKTTRLYKAVAKVAASAIIDCSPKKRWELPPQVVDMARRRGLTIDTECAETLVKLLGESTVLIDNELAKLATAFPQGRVGAADVERLVPRVAEFKPWDFTDALAKRDPALAMNILSQMDSSDLYGVFLQSVALLRELVAVKVLDREGQTAMVASVVGELRGKAVQAWQVKGHLSASRKYQMSELIDALKKAGECDAGLKSSSDKLVVFQGWILSFCR